MLFSLPKGQTYLATPFTKLNHKKAFEEASRITSHLVGRGLDVFSPIVHGFPLCSTMNGNLDPVDAALWIRINAPHMMRSSALIAAKMDGWKDSTGVAEEILDFGKRGKPCFTLCPDSFELEPMTFEFEGAVG